MPTYRLMAPTGSFPLAGKELTVGSSPDCQIRAEGPEVASHHARVVIREGQPPLIEPFSSTCQVFIDGQAVAGQAELRPGQILRVGTTELHLELSSETAEPTPRKRPLWKRLVRWSLYGVGTLAALITLVIVLIPVILSEARVKQKLKDVLEEQLRRDVSIGSVELQLLHGLRIRDLRVENKEGFSTDKPFLTVKEIDVRAEVWPFLKSRFHRLAASVTIREPAVYLEREATKGALNTAGMFEGEADQKGGKKRPQPGKEPAAGKGKSSGGPLGPLQDLNFKLVLENGSLLFDDRREKTSGRVEGLVVKADVTDFNVPELRGKFSYSLDLAAPNPGHPGKVSVRGGADLDLKESASPSFLGLDIERLAGELVNVDVKDLDLAGLAKCFNFPTPGPTSVQLTVAPVAAKPLTLKVTGWVNTPQIDAVALGLNAKPVPGLGAKVSIDGQADLETGSASLKVDGQSGLWKKLGGTIQVEELPALAVVVGGVAKPSPAAKVKLDFSVALDLAKLTGGEVGRLFGAKAAIGGDFGLTVKAEGPVTDLPATVDLSLKDVIVPREYTDGKELPPENMSLSVSGRAALDPRTLECRRITAAAAITSAAVRGDLANGIYVPGTASSAGQLGGEVTFKANFKKVLERYKQVLTGVPVLDEDLSLTASASSAKGPIALRVELETRREGAQPDPIKISLAANLEAGKDWNFRNVDLKAKTQSSALDFSASGSVLKALSDPDVDVKFGSPKIDLAALRGRLDQLIKLGGEKLAKLDVRGQLSLSGGEVKGTLKSLTSKLTMDLSGLEVSGFGKDGKESLKDSKISLILNVDLEPEARSLKARTVSLTSSICNLNLSGDVRDWSALLGEYKFSLEADAEKTVALLRAMDLFKANLYPKGKAVVALSADTKAGTVAVERFRIDLVDLATVRISGKLHGLLLEKLRSKDEQEAKAALEGLGGELVLEECSTRLDVLNQLRDTIPGIPKELSGSGPVNITAKAAGSKGKIALGLDCDATKAALAFTGLINKPAETAAKVILDGTLALDAKSQALRIGKLDVRLGELHLTGSGSSALDLSSVQVALDIPKFAPEGVRAMFPPLADFTFGGKVEFTGLSLAGNLKEVLDSKQDVFTGRLAGLTFGGKARLEDVSLETKALPHMKLRADGTVEVDTGSVKLDGLSAGIIHKRTQQETRFTVTKGLVTSAVKDGRLLTDLGKLCGEKLAVTCPEAKVDEVLLAIETPTVPGAAKPPTTPAGPKPPAAGAAGPAKPAPGAKPYDFLAGYVLKESTIKIGRVSYLNYVVTDLAGSMAVKDNLARVYDFKAKAYKGDVAGKVNADLNVLGIAHSGDLRLVGVDVDTAATAIMAYADIFHGKVSGTVTWTGAGVKPEEFDSLDGKVQIKYEEGLVRNIEKFPPLREAVGSLGQMFLPALVKQLQLAEFKLAPTELNLVLEAVDRKPVIRAKDKDAAFFRTVDADPLEVGLLGGLCLFPDAKGEFPFLKDTRMYIQRFPEKWLEMVDSGTLVRGGGGQTIAKKLRELFQRSAKDRKVYLAFSGTVQNPKVGKWDFVKDVVKEIGIKDVIDVLKDTPLDDWRKKLPKF